MQPPSGSLPLPDSDQVKALLPRRLHQLIYLHLYQNRDNGLTRQELRALLADELGEQEQLDRRARELNKKFVIETSGSGKQTRHHLRTLKTMPGANLDEGVTGAQRWRVLEKGKCFGCGRRPESDEIRLVVDHIVPQDLGGSSEDWNLQPLCEQCNADKKARFSAFNEHRSKIRSAIAYKEVQRRIGELLIAFGGEPVPADLVQVVASAGEFRNDWERRFRDLRTLGWDVRVRKYRIGNQYTADYWVEHAEPWPEEPIARVVARIERAKKKAPPT